MEINVLYQFNEKYAPYANVSMTSLMENNKDADGITIYVMADNVSETSANKLQTLADKYNRNIEIINTDELVAYYKKSGLLPYRGTYSIYNRFFFLKYINKNVDRLLYIDSDTVVLGSLSNLFSMDLDNKPIGMVLESLGSYHKYEIGLKKESGYYNSGMILFDVDKWRAGAYEQKIYEYVNEHRPEFASPDQDLINVVLEGNIYRLPIEYNFQPHHEIYTTKQYRRAFKPEVYYTDDEIVHGKDNKIIEHCFRWIGEFAWHKGNLHPFNKDFDKYLALSQWSDYVKLKEKTPLSISIEKVLYRILPKGLFLVIFSIALKMYFNNKSRATAEF